MDSILLLSVGVFVSISLTLSATVLLARSWLLPQGDTTVQVNGQQLDMPNGANLLRALGANGIFLSSPCGGRAICGECRVRFVDPSSAPLPTERNHLSRREVLDGVRLACAHKVRPGLALQVPEQQLNARRLRCTVKQARNVSTYLRELTFSLPPDSEMPFEAGQYVLLHAEPFEAGFDSFHIEPEYRKEWDRAGLLSMTVKSRDAVSRAYSLASNPANTREFVLLIRIAVPPAGAKPNTPPGIVSSYAYTLRPGNVVDITGPFGDFRASKSDREMVLIGGGAGLAPLRAIVLDQLTQGGSERRLSLWLGVRNAKDICYEEDFDRLAREHDNFSWVIALSDPGADGAWTGATGFIHQVVHDRLLATHPAPEEAEYYICGPPVMSLAVRAMLEDLGVDAESVFLDDFGADR